jgi:hypothetical protein
VRRAKRSAHIDLTPALLASASKCEAVPLPEQAGSAQSAAPPPAWLAFRVASHLPQADSCRTAGELLRLGAAASACAAPAPTRALLTPAGREAGDKQCITAPETETEAAAAVVAAAPGMCLGEAAARLLAAARHQSHPLGLAERAKRFFGQRTSSLRCGAAQDSGYASCLCPAQQMSWLLQGGQAGQPRQNTAVRPVRLVQSCLSSLVLAMKCTLSSHMRAGLRSSSGWQPSLPGSWVATVAAAGLPARAAADVPCALRSPVAFGMPAPPPAAGPEWSEANTRPWWAPATVACARWQPAPALATTPPLTSATSSSGWADT